MYLVPPHNDTTTDKHSSSSTPGLYNNQWWELGQDKAIVAECNLFKQNIILLILLLHLLIMHHSILIRLSFFYSILSLKSGNIPVGTSSITAIATLKKLAIKKVAFTVVLQTRYNNERNQFYEMMTVINILCWWLRQSWEGIWVLICFNRMN